MKLCPKGRALTGAVREVEESIRPAGLTSFFQPRDGRPPSQAQHIRLAVTSHLIGCFECWVLSGPESGPESGASAW